MIICKNLKFGYANKQLLKINDFTMAVGEKIWIRGPSGSGKSTFLAILAGLIKPEEGSLSVGGVFLERLSEKELLNFRKSFISYVHQENHFIDHWTVTQNLSLTQTTLMLSNLEFLIKKFNLTSKFLTERVASLSGGEKQRLSIISVVLEHKPYIFLDEPSAHLDDANFQILCSLLNDELKDLTIVVVSHDSRFFQTSMRRVDFKELNL